jgi:hypothetical protein
MTVIPYLTFHCFTKFILPLANSCYNLLTFYSWYADCRSFGEYRLRRMRKQNKKIAAKFKRYVQG